MVLEFSNSLNQMPLYLQVFQSVVTEEQKWIWCSPELFGFERFGIFPGNFFIWNGPQVQPLQSSYKEQLHQPSLQDSPIQIVLVL